MNRRRMFAVFVILVMYIAFMSLLILHSQSGIIENQIDIMNNQANILRHEKNILQKQNTLIKKLEDQRIVIDLDNRDVGILYDGRQL